MLKVLIIEDEKLAADKLVMLLKSIEPDAEIVGIIDSVSNSIQWLTNHSADLIFMDINLSDDISFKIFESVNVETPIIFTTAYDQFAIKAFEQNSIAYLLKPIDKDELEKSLQKYHRFGKQNSPIPDSLHQLFNQFKDKENNTQEKKRRLMVSYGGKMRAISISDIALFYVHEKAVYLVTQSAKKYVIDETLDTLENWVEPHQFFRVNRKYLVNIKSITEVVKYSQRKLKLSLEVETPSLVLVPSEKITKFKNWLNN